MQPKSSDSLLAVHRIELLAGREFLFRAIRLSSLAKCAPQLEVCLGVCLVQAYRFIEFVNAAGDIVRRQQRLPELFVAHFALRPDRTAVRSGSSDSSARS